ncbi:UDP-glucose/GDP-mannose dehydrogenase family protein [Desulfonatronospira sp.]|uniref:UDP-glucose dehydrogenase family protein n=1 Tax=Desulfonatronospira sp. TaxID=1962951 RepID=UPI0025BC540A|nr:UDP-glucose/GDP-mannose dehydrogenase family protein [Desulfonatronospira sp.]
MEISVIGPGYVGLVTAVVFSEMGNNVRCVGRRQEQVDALSSGKVTIYEPGLEEIMVRNLKNGRLKFTVDVRQAVSDSEIVFICVGTPPGQDGSSDLSAVYKAAETVGDLITKYTIVVNKSTVPVGTADRVREIIESRLKKRNVQCDFDVVSNPEFLKEGDALNDFLKPDRIVVGTSSEKAAMKMKELYSGFSLMQDKLIFMDVRSSEMTKYASNCMLAAKISFINEIANICERVGADVACVRQGVGSDRRIGYQFIYPGAGYGGSCFPKDVKALISTARKSAYTPELLEAIENVNARQKKIVAQKFFRLPPARFTVIRKFIPRWKAIQVM